MSRYTIEFTIKGSTRPAQLNYHVRADAMDQWDTSVDNAIGGDKLRLLDNSTGRVLSEYNPIDRSTDT